MSTPGAEIVMWLPMLEPLNRSSLASVADTAITFGSAAGYCGGEFGPKLPEAATSTTPLLCAARRWRDRPGSDGPAKLMLMTRAFCSAAYSRPLRIAMLVASAEEPTALNALMARIRAAGA